MDRNSYKKDPKLNKNTLPAFPEVFDNPEDFNFLGMNISKYFYDHSITRKNILVNKPVSNKGLLKHSFLSNPILVVNAFIKLVYLVIASRNKIIFYGNSNRIIKEGNAYFDSFNFNIIKDIGPKKVLIIQDRGDFIKGKIFSPNLIIDDLYPLLFIIKKIFYVFHRKELLEFDARIGSKLKVLGFSDDECVTKLLEFSIRYVFFSFLLSRIKPKSVLLTCHYSKHALIAACRQLSIPVIELMHGQILPNHRYYNNLKVSPEFITSFRKWSLPDKIGVYGDFWKNTLIEGKFFTEASIINIGYYQKLPEIKSPSLRENRKITILIASDGIMQSYFLNYIKFLKTKLDKDKFKIIIKLHPSEDGRIFTEVVDSQFVFLEEADIYQLFSKADVLISVYSTVIFEATLFDIRIYSMFIPKYQKHCEMILKTGAAERLNMDQIPDFSPSSLDNKRVFLDKYNFKKFSILVDLN